MGKSKTKPEEKTATIEDELFRRLGLRPTSSISNWSYDDFLEYFRKVPAGNFIAAMDELEILLPNEGYAAAKRWAEIFENPSKMDKLHQGRLAAKNKESIMALAVGDDDEAFYEALIRENVTKLEESGNSTQEVARLSQIINVLRSQLREIRSRKPKKDSALAKILEAAAKPPKPAPKRLKTPKTKRSAKSSTVKPKPSKPKKEKVSESQTNTKN